MKPGRRPAGFTLVELLVALLILALLAVAGYRGLDAVLQARMRVEQETRRWQQVSYFFSRLEQDVAQAIQRPVRDASGRLQPEWVGQSGVVRPDEAEWMFTRAGDVDVQGQLQAPQRIGYRLEQGNVVQLRWPALEPVVRALPQRYPVLEGVREFKLRYMDANRNWQTQWPVPGSSGGLPRAVEVVLILSSGEVLTRVLALQ